MTHQPNGEKRTRGASGLAIPGGVLLGLGLGVLFNNVVAGVLIGLGCGFLMMGVLRVMAGDW